MRVCARARVLVLVLVLVGPLTCAAPAAADDGPWGWPLGESQGGPAVARAFAPPASAYGAGHRGVDLPASPGAAVRAAAAGRVTYAGRLAGRGVVVVTHGALRTTYEPVTAAVPVGAQVARGQVLGELEAGHLGCPAAACLHWGLRRGEEYLDPVRLVRRGPVRLLPVAAGPVINAGVPEVSRRADVRKSGVDQPAGGREPVPGSGSEVSEPGWSLRAAEAPLGMAAVAALVLGIALLARPRPDPAGPASGGTAAAAGPPVVLEEAIGPRAQLLDLEQARLRRLTG